VLANGEEIIAATASRTIDRLKGLGSWFTHSVTQVGEMKPTAMSKFALGETKAWVEP